MPFYMHDVLGFSPAKTGYTMMVYPLVMAVVAPISGWLSDKIGSYSLTTAGLLVNALAFGLLNTLSTNESAWMVGLHLGLFGLGGGLFQSPNNSSIMGSVSRDKLGTAGGLNALVRNIGMVLGTSLSISIYSSRLSYLRPLSSGEPEAALHALHTVFGRRWAFVCWPCSSPFNGCGLSPGKRNRAIRDLIVRQNSCFFL